MQDTFNHELENNASYMLDMIREDYKNYFNASYSLRNNPIFILESIYQCISQINNDENYTSPEHKQKIYNQFCKKVYQRDYKVKTSDGYRVMQKTAKKSPKKNRLNIFH